MKQIIKRYLISTLITFIGTFLVVFCTFASADTFTWEKSVLVATTGSALLAAARAAVKIVWEIGSYLLTIAKSK